MCEEIRKHSSYNSHYNGVTRCVTVGPQESTVCIRSDCFITEHSLFCKGNNYFRNFILGNVFKYSNFSDNF